MSLQQYNQDVSRWGNDTKRKLKLQVLQMVASKDGPGANNQQVRVQKYMGLASKINFSFPYYMAFVHKGAGRGYGGHKTGLFTKKDGSKGVTNQNAMGKMGTGQRTAKPWFNPVLESQFPALADLVANYHGEKVILNIQKILIK